MAFILMIAVVLDNYIEPSCAPEDMAISVVACGALLQIVFGGHQLFQVIHKYDTFIQAPFTTDITTSNS